MTINNRIKSFGIFLIFLNICSCAHSSAANEAASLSKSTNSPETTKTYTNKKYNYELKYPQCWKLEVNSADDDEKDIESAFVLQSYVPKNCTGFHKQDGFDITTTSRIEDKFRLYKEISDLKGRYRLNKENPEDILSKELSVSNIKVFAGAEDINDYIRWNYYFFCKKAKIKLVFLDYEKDIVKINKIKSGEILFPKVYEDIVNSFKCLDDSKKENVKK